jgi:hypothetical protein
MDERCAVVFLGLALLSGCAHDVNRHNAVRYAEAGEAALLRGDWDAARRAYAQAAVNADLGRVPVRARSPCTTNMAEPLVPLASTTRARVLDEVAKGRRRVGRAYSLSVNRVGSSQS